MRRLLLPLSIFTVAACGGFLSASDDDSPPPSTPDAASPSADAATSDASNQVDASACVKAEPRYVAAKEDTCALECAGTITYGAAGFCHVGFDNIALMYLAFDIPPDVTAALAGGRVARASVVLVEDPAENVNKSGTLGVHVLTNDWVAGKGQGERDGADLCRRDDGDPGVGWGSGKTPGETTRIAEGIDYGPSLGTAPFTEATSQVTIALDVPSLVIEWKGRASGGDKLSLLVQETAAGSFVAASSNHASLPKPMIVFEVCP